ncbi:MAG: hypothetical protein AB7O97_22430 [Planctomycetota bacterium]
MTDADPPHPAPAPAPGRRRRVLRRTVLSAALTGLLLATYLALFGWTLRVHPPTDPPTPVTALLIRDQLHRGLLLPQPGGGYVEFGFGDWAWYAEGREHWTRVFATVLWPTPGALSRRELAGADPAAVRAALPWAQFEDLVVGAAAAERLRLRLEEQFAAGRVAATQRPALRMGFVPWARSYWFVDNCSTAVAGWCAELGCAISGPPLAFDVAAAR